MTITAGICRCTFAAGRPSHEPDHMISRHDPECSAIGCRCRRPEQATDADLQDVIGAPGPGDPPSLVEPPAAGPPDKPGPAFEAAVLRSFGTLKHPNPPGRWVWKVPSPQHRRPEQATSKGKAQIRFAPRMPFDVQVVWPRITRRVDDDGFLKLPPVEIHDGSHTFVAECKSTAVPRLSFDVLWHKGKPWQRDQLAGVAAAGGFAGVLWEYRPDHGGSLAGYVPIEKWAEAERRSARKSLSWYPERKPTGLSMQELGVCVERDTDRGTVKPYWRMPDLLRALAGER